MKSLEVGYWVDEEPYELSDAFPAAQVGGEKIAGARATGTGKSHSWSLARFL